MLLSAHNERLGASYMQNLEGFHYKICFREILLKLNYKHQTLIFKHVLIFSLQQFIRYIKQLFTGCKKIRVRKNVNDLTNEEIERLQKKIKHAIKTLQFQDLAQFHGAPIEICGEEICCPHGKPTFLSWHRLYLVNMEEILDEALPYWDWTEDTQIPKLFDKIQVPFKKGSNSTLPAKGKKSPGAGVGDCPSGQSCRNIKLVQVPLSFIGEKGKGGVLSST